MQTKKLISYLSCEKFEKNIFTSLEERYKCNIIKDAVIINLEEDEQIILFKYGVFICWNVKFENIKFFMDFIKNFEINSFEIPFIEELNYTLENEFKINFDTIYLNNLSNISKIAISQALAQNVKLDQFEKELLTSIENNSSIPLQLAHTGKINLTKKEISKKIGELFLVKSKMNLHYDLLDTPEFFWEYPEYENQYEKLIKYLDIKSRVEVLNKKLEVIQELLHVLGDEQKHRYSSFLEWIIIILIAFEIVINIKDHF
ncbi:MAG: RMD1 family protein [Arcobacter sp.]|uniref:RMD1 family protein n=1 Tax=Arcobacter sp. TaxID=1872629 RepID=UPI003D01AF19